MVYFISHVVDTYFAYLESVNMNIGEAKLRQFLDDEDAGVPLPMFASEPDTDGQVYWKTIPSGVSAADLARISDTLGVELPACLREFFCYKHILACEAIFLPSFPSDMPFSALQEQVTAWQPLISAGYFPYSFFEDGRGPVCIDLESADLCRLVYFYADQLWGLGESGCCYRTRVLPLENLIADSFADQMKTLQGKYKALTG